MIIEAKNIKKSYDGSPVLDDISLVIHKGDFVSIMGESGSGKSTLINILSTILTPSSGTVLYDNVDIYRLPEKDRSYIRCHAIGIVYQFFNLIPSLTVEDNILVPVYLRKENVKIARKTMQELLEYLHIEDIAKKHPNQISGGQQQRVAIARALIYQPEYLFLDEPTGNLDSRNSEQILRLLQKIKEEKQVSVMQVTHSQAHSLYGNRLLTIQDGKIVKDENLL